MYGVVNVAQLFRRFSPNYENHMQRSSKWLYWWVEHASNVDATAHTAAVARLKIEDYRHCSRSGDDRMYDMSSRFLQASLCSILQTISAIKQKASEVP